MPQKQGSQDGACGFYAMGNALLRLCPELSVDKIFYEIFKYYTKKGKPIHFIEGLYRNKLNEILSHVVEVLKDKGFPGEIDIVRPYWTNASVAFSDFNKKLDEHFNNTNHTIAVAIIGYAYCKNDPEEDGYAHWTVITKKTPKRLYTFDSDQERKFLPLSMCRIWDERQKHRVKPYKIQPTETFLLSRQDKL
jgi:hypothetical protein